ncbi:MAG: hypothetical protein EOL91_13435 [Actinobacteria bacterium]|nr:hypothetical protein [Actinomycetota bacterium]
MKKKHRRAQLTALRRMVGLEPYPASSQSLSDNEELLARSAERIYAKMFLDDLLPMFEEATPSHEELSHAIRSKAILELMYEDDSFHPAKALSYEGGPHHERGAPVRISDAYADYRSKAAVHALSELITSMEVSECADYLDIAGDLILKLHDVGIDLDVKEVIRIAKLVKRGIHFELDIRITNQSN